MHLAWYIVFSIIALVLIAAGIAVLTVKQPNLSNCSRAGPMYIQPQCVSVYEKYADDTINGGQPPAAPIYLLQFTYNSGAASLGGPPCQPMWYAYRYVRLSDGGYGPLSAWTTNPINAGATDPPCAPVAGVDPSQYCTANGISTGDDTCTFNQPVVGTVDDLELSSSDGYVLNLHRQVGTFDPTSEGDLVGQLIAPTRTSSSGNPTSYWYDVAFNTNPKGQRCCAT